CTFELANVGGDAAGDERHQLGVGDLNPVRPRLFLEDRDARLEVGRLNVGHEPPLEARTQPLLERCDLPRRPIGRNHDLLAGLVQRVERVEELLLDPLFVLQELDVIDQKHAKCAVALLEALNSFVAERVDEVVHEALARDVTDGEVTQVFADVVADRLKEGGLTEAGPAVDEERVVGLRWRFPDGEGGGVREAVRRPDDERVERVLRVQALDAWAWLGPGASPSPRLVFRNYTLPPPLVAGGITNGSIDQPEKMTFDPLA